MVSRANWFIMLSQPDEKASEKETKADLDAAKSKSRLANLRDLASKSNGQAVNASDKTESDSQEDSDLSTYTLDKYGDAHFNLHRKGVLKQKSTVEKMLRWKADAMKMGLTKLSDDLSNEAVQVLICNIFCRPEIACSFQ